LIFFKIFDKKIVEVAGFLNKETYLKIFWRPLKVALYIFNIVFRKKFKRGGFPRKMVKGSWICSDCGKEITELPFEPSADRPVYCRECWAKKRER
jgi:CxxC-x17-CxxC domain-containing protein